MNPKAVFLLPMIALAAAQPGAMAQSTPPPGGVAVHHALGERRLPSVEWQTGLTISELKNNLPR